MQDSLRTIERLTSLPTLPTLSRSKTTSLQIEIAGLAQQLSRLTSPLLTSRLETSVRSEITPLDLQSPPDLKPRFKAFGISDGVASALTHTVTQHAEALRKLCVAHFEESCDRLKDIPQPSKCIPLSNTIEKSRSTYRLLYEQQLREWTDKLIPALLNGITTSKLGSTCAETSSPVKPKAPKFNHEFVPLLEKYFNLNPFPSHADKAVLARKSGMEYRQIAVWFQNRRSRAKKDGKVLKKLLIHEEPKVSVEALEEQMGGWVIPEHERVDPVDSDVSEYEWQYDTDEEDTSAWTPRYPLNPDLPDVLNVAPPPHAFPSVYPPVCGYEPFPVKEGKHTFPAPVWMRHPAKSIKRRPTVDLDELIDDFTRMNLRVGPRKRWVKKDPRKPTDPKRTQTPPPRPDRSAATLFITTRPLPAPIPALIREAVPIQVTPPSPVTAIPPVPIPPQIRPARTPIPLPALAPLLSPTPPTSSSGKPTRRRKMAPLPKRTPAGTSVAHRGVTPASPESSVASSPSPPRSSSSRKSSFGSDCSSLTRSSSSSSSASSVVVTPVSSPMPLPDPPSSPSMSYNIDPIDALFGDDTSGRVSPVEGIRPDLPPAADFHLGFGKQRFDFTFGTSTPTSFARGES